MCAVAGYNGHHSCGFNLGYVFRLNDQTIYHIGDTDRVPEMVPPREVDVALVPIGNPQTPSLMGSRISVVNV